MKPEITDTMIDERIAAMAWSLFEDFSIVDVSDALGVKWGHKPTFEMIKRKSPDYAAQVKKCHAYAITLVERKFTRSEIRDEILEDLEMDERERRMG